MLKRFTKVKYHWPTSDVHIDGAYGVRKVITSNMACSVLLFALIGAAVLRGRRRYCDHIVTIYVCVCVCGYVGVYECKLPCL